ncbi:hypothetical protein BpHYR1_006033 [Brachionus plicatilis]|uniref:Uncharacterized protein n=1 Tax=Brachionus plicatilis TaxID=10195 RepID=A0A3M7PXW1_BRAPC|nr:hypothetical protein BpHYR1_006033 [Brachionus plicatilis]
MAKYHIGFIRINGIGKQVKKTVISRNTFRPQMSDRAPISGALRNDKIPLTPWINPLAKNVLLGNVSLAKI